MDIEVIDTDLIDRAEKEVKASEYYQAKCLHHLERAKDLLDRAREYYVTK